MSDSGTTPGSHAALCFRAKSASIAGRHPDTPSAAEDRGLRWRSASRVKRLGRRTNAGSAPGPALPLLWLLCRRRHARAHAPEARGGHRSATAGVRDRARADRPSARRTMVWTFVRRARRSTTSGLASRAPEMVFWRRAARMVSDVTAGSPARAETRTCLPSMQRRRMGICTRRVNATGCWGRLAPGGGNGDSSTAGDGAPMARVGRGPCRRTARRARRRARTAPWLRD